VASSESGASWLMAAVMPEGRLAGFFERDVRGWHAESLQKGSLPRRPTFRCRGARGPLPVPGLVGNHPDNENAPGARRIRRSSRVGNLRPHPRFGMPRQVTRHCNKVKGAGSPSGWCSKTPATAAPIVTCWCGSPSRLPSTRTLSAAGISTSTTRYGP